MSGQASRRAAVLVFALTVFLSAFLLFQVQPLIGKCILPWFGGTPAVWTTCMLFFQTLLFAGYAYAHFSARWFTPARQALWQAALLATAVWLLPIMPDAAWKPQDSDLPTLRIVLVLTVSVGLPYFILASTGPLLQHWFNLTQEGRSPYRLYALSNLGSLLALLSYPFVFEPAWSIHHQALIWSGGFLLFGLVCTACAVLLVRLAPQSLPSEAAQAHELVVAPPPVGTRLLWFGLAMVASVMLLATTNQVCMDVAVIPFLWVLPLALYLLSFILCFDSDRWYSRRLYALAAGVSMAAVCLLIMKGAGGSIVAQVIVYFAALFFCCMVCHGELVALKPDPSHLTGFYLTISAGGAAGGLFVGLLAPVLFDSYFELHLGILGCGLLTLAVFLRDDPRFHAARRRVPRWAWSAGGLTVLALAALLRTQAFAGPNDDATRNFYGVLRITAENVHDPENHRVTLMHGRILHGQQFVAAHKRRIPTAYYGRDSGVGIVLRRHRADRPRRVGVVGLGVGTLAAYGLPSDHYRFYEINPDVVRYARERFTFLADSPAEIEVAPGDARLTLEHEPPQKFDVLVLDAFSGDAIPVHLLTREAAEIYRKHLRPDGVLAVHVSNLHFDLRPVVAGLAEHLGFAAVHVMTPQDDAQGTEPCLWMLLARDPAVLDIDELKASASPPDRRRLLWTDDRSNLFEVLRP